MIVQNTFSLKSAGLLIGLRTTATAWRCGGILKSSARNRC